MSSPESFGRNPDINKDSLAVDQLESDMESQRATLAQAYARVQETHKVMDGKPADTAESRTAWQAWKDARKVYGVLLEKVAEYEHVRAEKITVPDGRYVVSMTFENNKDKALKTLQAPMYNEHYGDLKNLIKASRSEISMRGIHNAGFYPEGGEFYFADCQYQITGPQDFAYSSACKVDRGGQIIRRAADVN